MKLNIESIDQPIKYYFTAKDLIPGRIYESEHGDCVIMLSSAKDPLHPQDFILKLNGTIAVGVFNGFTKFRPLCNKKITLTTDNEGA